MKTELMAIHFFIFGWTSPCLSTVSSSSAPAPRLFTWINVFNCPGTSPSLFFTTHRYFPRGFSFNVIHIISYLTIAKW